jgi:membrane-bound ClpP family serine protease
MDIVGVIVTVALLGGLLYFVWDMFKTGKAGQRLSGWRSGEKPTTRQSLVGMTGVAVSELAPSGMVHVNGEDWSAVSDSGETIEKGAEIVVLDVEGLTLKVFRANE